MAREHEKIPKVTNAPRKIRSQSSMGTLFAPLLGLGLAAQGHQRLCDFPGPGQERSSVPRRSFGLFPHHKGRVCTAHLQGE